MEQDTFFQTASFEDVLDDLSWSASLHALQC